MPLLTLFSAGKPSGWRSSASEPSFIGVASICFRLSRELLRDEASNVTRMLYSGEEGTKVDTCPSLVATPTETSSIFSKSAEVSVKLFVPAEYINCRISTKSRRNPALPSLVRGGRYLRLEEERDPDCITPETCTCAGPWIGPAGSSEYPG